MTYIKHPKHIPFEYSRINNNIYIGTNQCCQIHFKKILLKKGINADISLEKERIDYPLGIDYFLWLPVKDHSAPTQKQLELGSKAIKDLVSKRMKVYVHCKRGHGRSPTLVIAYFISEGMKYYDAAKLVREKRAIHLTKLQINALRKFEKNVN